MLTVSLNYDMCMKTINKNVKTFGLLLICILGTVQAQQLQKFEPADGRVFHGIGQYTGVYYTDEEYWQFVGDYQNAVENIPVIYSVYTAIDPYINVLDPTDFQDIVNNHNYPYVLLIGLSYHDSTVFTLGKLDLHVQSILNGELDEQIISLAQKIKMLEGPVFFRPGFEFGEGNSGIHNDPDMNSTNFKNIWLHIYEIFTNEDVTNVAWVWNTVNPNAFNYMDWYPGDEYVDWWGINYFTKSQIDNSDSFLDSAEVHNKPVIICESNPIHNGGTTNSNNWDNFFVPYFEKIKNYNNIKAFVYINSSWTKEPLFDWPDSRIYSNETIRSNYTEELQDSIYIHMDEYLADPDSVTSIEKGFEKNPVKNFYFKFSNYPNPFNGNTTITWEGLSNITATISIYDIRGVKVSSFKLDNTDTGMNSIVWETAGLSSGIYYAVLKPEKEISKISNRLKMILIK